MNRSADKLFKKNIIGCFNNNFKTSDVIRSETYTCKINNYLANFDIIYGPLFWQGKSLEETFVLEILYGNSYNEHSDSLGAYSFSAGLIYEYTEKVHELASNLINQKKWTLSQHLNSWPQFQAIVFE